MVNPVACARTRAVPPVNAVEELWVPEPRQWLSETAGRTAPDGYSWLQAVHWAADSGLYRPRRAHGPRFGETTVRIARELSRLSPCRPGVAHLERVLGVSERTVQYHLQMLRQAGLLAYVRRGSRVRGVGARASEFARMIPEGFDRALGIRTAGEGVRRRMVGIDGHGPGRERIAVLARKAARTLGRRGGGRRGPARRQDARRPRGDVRCTPMWVASSRPSGAGGSLLPPEAELAGGKRIGKRGSGRGGRLNVVGRRHQLAGELIREVGWLGRCQVPRIAWIVRHVADAGWTAAEVRAWLHLRGEADAVRRPSGLLATLLAGAERLLDTPAKRADAVTAWRDSPAAARRRHGSWAPAPCGPRGLAVRRLVAAARNARTVGAAECGAVVAAPVAGTLTTLSDADRTALRETARGEFLRGETTLIASAVRAWGRAAAEEFYGAELVHRAARLASGTALMAVGSRA
ncbi:helix-turn-helix domain-containing protein [Streptomyces sp. NPDC051183]|uniref:helix-turn-helix domain-containing protein n=1 Tax=Streptomyces sp. NPDC051183 TaxID=3155165 RepID=UPI003435870E